MVREHSEHELLAQFRVHGFTLNRTLQEMLAEHHSHSTERRGSGYTQATRHLAEYVNHPTRIKDYDDFRLFLDRMPEVVPRLRARAGALGAVDFDLRTAVPSIVSELESDAECALLIQLERERQRKLAELVEVLVLEESQILGRMMRDIVVPVDANAMGLIELPLFVDKLPIGTCPLAEKFFLELADGFVRRGGQLNVIVDSRRRPLMIEKLNLGDDHSCISLVPVVLNGVELPAGSLLGVNYSSITNGSQNRSLPGLVIPVTDCVGFRLLRLTTLAISPQNRRRAFSTHFAAQVSAGLFDPEGVKIDDLRRVAEAQVERPS